MKLKINGKLCEGHEGETLMEVARRNNINIPGLCYKRGVEGQGRCRLCLVEVKEGNRRRIVSACVYPIKDGIEVTTTTEEIVKMRKDIILMLLLRSPNNEYINSLARAYRIEIPERYLDKNKKEDCILCGLCVKACQSMGTSAISLVDRGINKKVSTPYDDASKDCIGCGACAEVCPTNAIKMIDLDGKRTIWNRTFDLIKCSRCGEYFITKEAYDHMENKLDEEKRPICDHCKKKAIAQKFKESFVNIS